MIFRGGCTLEVGKRYFPISLFIPVSEWNNQNE